MQPSEATLAFELFREQRLLLGKLGLNLWHVDRNMPGKLGAHDLLADFNDPSGHGIAGVVSPELKVFSECKYNGQLKHTKDRCEATLATFGTRCAVDAMLVIVAKVSKQSSMWRCVSVEAFLLKRDGSWSCLGTMGLKRVVSRNLWTHQPTQLELPRFICHPSINLTHRTSSIGFSNRFRQRS